MKDEKTKLQFSRRDFLKTTAVGVGTTVIAGAGVSSALAAEVKNAKAIKGTGSANAEPLPALSAPAKWDYETEVIVAGGGGAGLAAAVSATENGAKVILIEKNAFCGGDTSIAMVAEGIMGSRFQTKLGIKAPPLGQRVLAESNDSTITTPNATAARNPTLVRIIMENQASTMDWLEDMGVVYSNKAVYGLPAPGLGHIPIDPEHPEEDWLYWMPHTARGFTEALERKANALGVMILKEHPAIGLVTSGRRVIGVAARNMVGKVVYIKAKAVILATGGFGANREMLKKYVTPRRAEGARYWGMPGATGDGIRMAQALGADLRAMEEIEIWDGGALIEHGATTVYSAPNQLVRQKSLTVNKKAQRFFCESLYRGYYYSYQAAQTIAQPDQESFTLFDAKLVSRDDIIKKFHPVFCEYPCPWYEQQFDYYVAKGVIKKADTISELAKKLGLDPDVLVKTVDRYNRFCDKGEDSDFFKEAMYMFPIRTAPFYGVAQKGGTCFNTWGGLVVDEKFHVLDKKWDPIPGLFVSGENAAGGANVAYVLTGGRLTGKFAAGEIKG